MILSLLNINSIAIGQVYDEKSFCPFWFFKLVRKLMPHMFQLRAKSFE